MGSAIIASVLASYGLSHSNEINNLFASKKKSSFLTFGIVGISYCKNPYDLIVKRMLEASPTYISLLIKKTQTDQKNLPRTKSRKVFKY